ncbi:hypothetical protein TELCIR_14112 [Teladorsagia circumcincta]|uniref:Uncharacterized protein n=1 Tax=Teladorsagia circumcincta TaxID=45464 RepID=A0A2G9U289_TELCI|nr:hypothetical protein TELCIR_14112 [Teladorsagia circumcincta]
MDWTNKQISEWEPSRSAKCQESGCTKNYHDISTAIMDPDMEFNALSALYQSVIQDMKRESDAWRNPA